MSYPGMPLADLGEIQMIGGAGAEPHNMMAGFAATGAPITDINAHIDQAAPDAGIASLVMSSKPGLGM